MKTSAVLSVATVLSLAAVEVSAAVPAGVFSPYIDTTLWPTYNFVQSAKTTGQKYFTLAFITADPSNLPTWGGYASYGLSSDFGVAMRTQITQLRALGGDVTASFGGASGNMLDSTITTVPALTAVYQSVINAYNLTSIDIDIEGAAVANAASIARRSQAIAALQTANPNLRVSLTLPVLPTGLDNNGLAVMQSAVQYGARVDTVNIMAMDYGDSAAPSPSGKMGDYAIQAATSTFTQLGTLYPTLSSAQKWKMIGVTPMIGMNDVQTEVFDLNEARELQAWATAHDIGGLGMWSLNRDTLRTTPLSYVDLTSSSIVQPAFGFSNILSQFGPSTVATPEPATLGVFAVGGLLMRRRP